MSNTAIAQIEYDYPNVVEFESINGNTIRMKLNIIKMGLKSVLSTAKNLEEIQKCMLSALRKK